MSRRLAMILGAGAAVAAMAAAESAARSVEIFASSGDAGPPVGRGPGKGHKQQLRKIKAKGGPKRKAKKRAPRPSRSF